MNEKKSQDKISVIIPVYNTAPYLKRCLDSVLQSTYRNLEIICVNDGSTDESLSILEHYQALDDRVVVINKTTAAYQRHEIMGLHTRQEHISHSWIVTTGYIRSILVTFCAQLKMQIFPIVG